MQKERKLRAIRQVLGHEHITKGDEAVFTCPKCQHRKPKLSVNLALDHFHCWVCHFAGKNLAPLFPKNTPERKEYVESISEKLQEKKVEKKYDHPVLPNEFRTLSTSWRSPYYRQAIAYLSKRGIQRDDILLWKLGYCEDGDYKYRIIIPSFDEYGHMNFFVGRSFIEGVTKYKHGNFSKDIIFNDYLVDWDEPITITEGPFDAMKAAKNAIPLQGTILNENSSLFTKIVLSGVDVFFAMDKDAFDKQMKIMKSLLSYGVSCSYVNLGNKADVGEMSKDEFNAAKMNSTPLRSNLDLLKLRVTAQ